MRIADIQTAVIAANYDWTIIRIRTDEDAIGYGESLFARTWPPRSSAPV